MEIPITEYRETAMTRIFREIMTEAVNRINQAYMERDIAYRVELQGNSFEVHPVVRDFKVDMRVDV